MKFAIPARQICTAILLLMAGLVDSDAKLHAQSPFGFFSQPVSSGYECAHRFKLMPAGLVVVYGRANTSLGCSYEYMFDRENGIALYIPFVYGYPGAEQQVYNDKIQQRGANFIMSTEHTSWHVSPGIQLHTGARQGAVDFATGVGVVLGKLKAVYHYKSSSYPYDVVSMEDNYGLLGLALDNSLDYTHGHLLAGLSVRLGLLAEEHDFTSFIFAAGVHFGLRN